MCPSARRSGGQAVAQVTSVTSSGLLSSLPLALALSVRVVNKGLKSV